MATKYEIWSYNCGFTELTDFSNSSKADLAKEFIEDADDEYSCLKEPHLVAIKREDAPDSEWSFYLVKAEQSIDYSSQLTTPSESDEQYNLFKDELKEF